MAYVKLKPDLKPYVSFPPVSNCVLVPLFELCDRQMKFSSKGSRLCFKPNDNNIAVEQGETAKFQIPIMLNSFRRCTN